jgi:tellurium resistance protein TerD
MAINLNKGDRLDLNREKPGLSKIGVGLGWDPNQNSNGDYDLDASAFLIGPNGKLIADEYFVFYGNPKSPDGAVTSSGDDRTGGSSDGDDETLMVDLDKINPQVTEVLFSVTIYEGDKLNQNFGQVNNAFIRIYDANTNAEIAKYELNEDFSTETAVEFGKLSRNNGRWDFQALGQGYKGGLQTFVNKYA